MDRFDNWRAWRQIQTGSKEIGSDPLLAAIRLAKAETDRANKLFPDDQPGALNELLQRADELPDLRKALLFVGAWNVIRGELPVARSDWLHAEAERAKKLHSGNEAEAKIELLQRSRDMPSQRARLITMTAANVIAASRITV